MNGVRRLAIPRAVEVLTDPGGSPRAIAGHSVEAIRETWLLEDRWWTQEPVRRRYWEVITADGTDYVVFHDLIGNAWWAHR